MLLVRADEGSRCGYVVMSCTLDILCRWMSTFYRLDESHRTSHALPYLEVRQHQAASGKGRKTHRQVLQPFLVGLDFTTRRLFF